MGQSALLKQKETVVKKKTGRFELSRGSAAPAADFLEREEIGVVTSEISLLE